MTDRKQHLAALADRIEQLQGPDREVDAEIGATQGLRTVNEGHPLGICCYDKAGQSVTLPRYTASLDAAMTLVPEGYGFMVDGHAQDWFADLDAAQHMSASARAPALALLAAALRAQSETVA